MKQVTQKFMGRGQLEKRLSAQVGSKELADNILKKRGDMTASGSLTPKGEARNNMTAAERAIDRAKKRNKTETALSYNPKTNRATQVRK